MVNYILNEIVDNQLVEFVREDGNYGCQIMLKCWAIIDTRDKKDKRILLRR